MSPKKGSKRQPQPPLQQKDGEPATVAGGGGAQAKDNAGATAATSAAVGPLSADAAGALVGAGLATAQSAATSPMPPAIPAVAGGDGDGKQRVTMAVDDNGDDDADGEGECDGENESEMDDEELPPATGPIPAYGVPLEPGFCGRFPAMDADKMPVVTARATGSGGCCDLFHRIGSGGNVVAVSVCQKSADIECSANPGPRCSKSACLAAWHAEQVDSQFTKFGCAAHRVPSKNAMKQKSTVWRAYKQLLTDAGLLVRGAVQTAAFELLDADRVRIRAIAVVPEEQQNTMQRAVTVATVPIAGRPTIAVRSVVPPPPKATADRGKTLSGSRAHPDSKVVTGTQMAYAEPLTDTTTDVSALLERVAMLERAATNNRLRGAGSDNVHAAAALAASAPMHHFVGANRSLAAVASDMKSGALPATFAWNGSSANAYHPSQLPGMQFASTVSAAAPAAGQLPPLPGTMTGMDPMVALLMQQHTGVYQRPVDHAAREITSIDARAAAAGSRWFEVMREHAKQYKGKYEPWVHQLFLEMVTHLQRLLGDGKSWDEPLVAWLAGHMMALFYSGFGVQQSAKVALFRGHYVSHVMTDKAAAHVVNAPSIGDGRKHAHATDYDGDTNTPTGAGNGTATGAAQSKTAKRNKNRRAKQKEVFAQWKSDHKTGAGSGKAAGAGSGSGAKH